MSYQYKSVEEALKLLLQHVKLEPGFTEVELDNAVGMVLAEDIYAPIDLPPFDRSAVDGYAICSEAVSSASPHNPIPLKIQFSDTLNSCDEAIPVVTGQKMPVGADAVVMIEDVTRDNNTIYVTRPLSKYANVSRRGEDIKAGEKIASKGEIIKPVHVAIFSALGITKIKVFEKVSIGVIATGSEVVEPAYGIRAYEEGLILDSTSVLVRTTLSKYHFINTKWYGIIKDDEKQIGDVILKALNENQALVITGGTGPSDQDKTFNAVINVGKNPIIITRGLAIKPGRPTSIVVVENKPIFLLSGFPVAAYIALNVIVLNFLFKALGILDDMFVEVPASATKKVSGSIGYDTFVRARISKCGDELCVEPVLLHGSGVLKSLLISNALLVVPRNVEGFDKGDRIWVKIL
ncbi:MAG: molybdopterin molybdotransferase MoeA [Ignisphaera sp.]